jgi:hypothetical protein
MWLSIAYKMAFYGVFFVVVPMRITFGPSSMGAVYPVELATVLGDFVTTLEVLADALEEVNT